MAAQSIVQVSGSTIPAILAQLPAATRGELASMLILLGVLLGLALGAVKLFRMLFPERQPPIDADLALLASKEELKNAVTDLAEKIAANDMAHVEIRDQMREDVRREIAATAAAFDEMRNITRSDLADIRAQMSASCETMRKELAAALAADEARSSNIHRRLDPLIEKLSYVLGKLNVVGTGG